MASSLRISSLTRLLVQPKGKLPGIGKLNECFVSHQCRPIKLQGVLREETIGWAAPVVADEILTDRDSWDLSHSRVDQGFLLTLRIETRRVPNALAQYVTRDRIAKKEAKRTNPLSRAEKKELQKEVKQELAEMSLPNIKTVEGLWHTDRNELWVFTSSAKSVGQFETYFRETFKDLKMEVRLIDSPAFSLLAHEDDTEVWFDKIGAAIPSSFAGQATVV